MLSKTSTIGLHVHNELDCIKIHRLKFNIKNIYRLEFLICNSNIETQSTIKGALTLSKGGSYIFWLASTRCAGVGVIIFIQHEILRHQRHL